MATAFNLRSLKTRLAMGAALLGLVAALSAALVLTGMRQVSTRIDAALAAQNRIEGYSVLSTQVSRFLVVATEAVQTGLPTEARAARLERVADDIAQSFERIRADLERSVSEAAGLGIDAQTRRATTGLAVARMEAHFNATRAVLFQPDRSRENLLGYVDTFAIGFDPHLSEAISDELRLRNDILSSIDALKHRLSMLAFLLGALALALTVGAYLFLIRPQFRRLDRLSEASVRIAREDFAVKLPEEHRDEIGQLYIRTNQMAAALAERRDQVAAEWARLNDTIAARTEDLRNANAELARRDQDRRRFFADVSHELRGPLTVIGLESQLGRECADPDNAAAFDTIHGRAERLTRRIDDLLRVARSESGQLELESLPFNLPDMIAEVVDETRAEVESAGMTLDCPPMPDLRCVGDANWQRQVLASLVRNAVRHARDGGRIVIEARKDADAARVSVKDFGPGIPADRLPRIFDRFEQGQNDTRREGFGIGLSLAKWVAEAQSGEIRAESPHTDGPGTRVTVTIPLALAETAP